MTSQYARAFLNDHTYVQAYRPFEGRNNQLLQRLFTGKENGLQVDAPRLLISPKQLMIGRLGRINSDADTEYMLDNYIDTSTAVVPNPEGDEIKYVREHPLLYRITPETSLLDGNLPVTSAQYAAFPGFTLNAEQANALRADPYAIPDVRRQFWEQEAAEGDVKLANDYIADVEKRTGRTFEKNAMGLWLPSRKGLRLLSVYSVDLSRSDASGDGNLVDRDGRLLGVAAEPQIVARKIEDARRRIERFV